jgi:hypothetical protein
MVLQDGELILPKSEDKYPPRNTKIKVLHHAGGGLQQRIGDSYRLFFSEDIIAWIDGILNAKKD